MAPQNVRVRFAPSPTGTLHLGNIRAALFNYLFARQKKGTFVIRIEDTDPTRAVPGAGLKMLDDLVWLGIDFDEGPRVGGAYGPYLQSERTHLYEEKLQELIDNQKVYRCFCTPEELEQKRKEQLARKEAPRYDRTCLHLSDDMIKDKLVKKFPFVWRLRIQEDAIAEITTLERGIHRFELKNFSDFALTRQDGSFTFMLANFVDDWLMKISHVIRGEDHLSNTAMQAALFDAFAVLLPVFWHLPIIVNNEGKRLSKRDFGFSLDDLRDAGFLPEAICNYLVTTGHSFAQEVQSLDELAANFDFDHLHTTGSIHYDVEKLQWFNHQWIMKLSDDDLLERIRPFLHKQYPHSEQTSDSQLKLMLSKVKGDLKTLADISSLIGFYYQDPKISRTTLEKEFGAEKTKKILALIQAHLAMVGNHDYFMKALKAGSTEAAISPRELWGTIRYVLTGTFSGLGIHDLLEMFDEDELRGRLEVIFET